MRYSGCYNLQHFRKEEINLKKRVLSEETKKKKKSKTGCRYVFSIMTQHENHCDAAL